jgi:gliding motility-associated-like protein
MKNSFLSLFSLLLFSMLYTGCSDDDEQPNFYVGCCGTEPATYLVDGVNIYIPNSFTPNNDGINDFFSANLASPLPENFIIKEFIITSRAGQSLFEAYDVQPNDLASGWNGRVASNNELYVGLFNYRITIEDTSGNEQIIESTACAIRCEEDITVALDNPENCTFGLSHDGEGGYNPNLDSGESSCL